MSGSQPSLETFGQQIVLAKAGRNQLIQEKHSGLEGHKTKTDDGIEVGCELNSKLIV